MFFTMPTSKKKLLWIEVGNEENGYETIFISVLRFHYELCFAEILFSFIFLLLPAAWLQTTILPQKY